MDRNRKILQLAERMGLIRPRDVEAVGIPREYLLRLYRKGDLARVGRGLYALPGVQGSESLSLAEVAKRVPEGRVAVKPEVRIRRPDSMRCCSQHLQTALITGSSGLPMAFTDEFRKDVQKRVQWRAFVRKSKPEFGSEDLDTVIGEVSAFLMPIIESVRQDKHPDTLWPKGGSWTKMKKS